MLACLIALADLHTFPILRFSLALEGRDLVADHPALEQWLATMHSRLSVRRTQSKYEVEA